MGTNKINISIKNKNNRIQDKAHKIILTINILIRCFVYWLVSTFRIIVINADTIPPNNGHKTIICDPISTSDQELYMKTKNNIIDKIIISIGNIKEATNCLHLFFKTAPP